MTEKLKVNCIDAASFMIGPTALETMEDMDGTGEVARFIAEHGEGIMVFSLNVDRTEHSMELLKRRVEPGYGDDAQPLCSGKNKPGFTLQAKNGPGVSSSPGNNRIALEDYSGTIAIYIAKPLRDAAGFTIRGPREGTCPVRCG